MRVLKTCLTKCGEVLEQSAGVFGGVQESSLLQEICEVEEGRNKLRGRLVRTRGYGLTCITLDMLHECYVQACLHGDTFLALPDPISMVEHDLVPRPPLQPWRGVWE